MRPLLPLALLALLLPGRAAAADWEVHIKGALGAQGLVYVGDESDVVRYDPALRPTIRLVQSALELEVEAPFGLFAEIRLEDGLIHGGELEATEALIGWMSDPGYFGAWLGRGEVPWSRDRDMESEDHALSIRPTLSRVLVPIHANGFGLGGAWPDRLGLHVGASFRGTTADAPHLWARLRIHPVGALPAGAATPSQGPRFQLAAGVVHRPSESLGTLTLLAVDGTFRWGPLAVDVGWQRQFAPVERDQWTWEVGSTIVPIPGGTDIHLHARLERVTALVEPEDARWTVAARLGWRALDRRLVVYVEMYLPLEQGDAVSSGEDVVDLGRGIERRNEVIAMGVQGRFQ